MNSIRVDTVLSRRLPIARVSGLTEPTTNPMPISYFLYIGKSNQDSYAIANLHNPTGKILRTIGE